MADTSGKHRSTQRRRRRNRFPATSAREALFESLLQSAPDAIVIINQDGEIVLVNSRAEQVFGYDRGELIGQPVEILVPERFREAHVAYRQQFIDEPRTRPMGIGLDLLGRRRDGTEIPVEISLSPLTTPEGILVTAIIRNISERKRIEEELRNRAHKQAIVAQLGRRALTGIDVYMLMDEAAVLLCQVLGVEFCDVLECRTESRSLLLQAGCGWKEGLVGRLTEPATPESLAGHVLVSQLPLVIEDHQGRKEYRIPPRLKEHGVRSTAYVNIYGGERSFGVLGAHSRRPRSFTLDDVHFLQSVANVLSSAIERKRHEQAQRERDLIRAEQMVALGQVAAGMAHELRNPLTSIKGLVQVNLREAEARGLPNEDLRIIEQEIRRMERTLQTFLDFARPPKLERRELELAPLVERVTSLIGGRAGKQNVRLLFDRPPQPVTVSGDADQLQQLILNLALNALDAMPKGGELMIRLHAPAQNEVRLEIEDTGHGLPRQLIDRLFDPFVSTKETGLGLGLAVSRRIAEDHGGTLTAANRPEGGARFVVSLPADSNGVTT